MIVLLASLPCGAWAVRLNRKRTEQRWVAEIEQLRGSVWYDWQRGINNRPEPEWLQELMGRDFFARPVMVDLSNLAILSEAQILELHVLPSVTELSIRGELTDAALQRLARLDHLEVLRLHATRLEPGGLAHLVRLPKLHTLALEGWAVNDAPLRYLENLRGLRNLSLANSVVTDAGLVHLRGLSQLESLSLARSEISDRGLAHLAALSGLKKLELGGTRVTENGLQEMAKLKTLSTLGLDALP